MIDSRPPWADYGLGVRSKKISSHNSLDSLHEACSVGIDHHASFITPSPFLRLLRAVTSSAYQPYVWSCSSSLYPQYKSIYKRFDRSCQSALDKATKRIPNTSTNGPLLTRPFPPPPHQLNNPRRYHLSTPKYNHQPSTPSPS